MNPIGNRLAIGNQRPPARGGTDLMTRSEFDCSNQELAVGNDLTATDTYYLIQHQPDQYIISQKFTSVAPATTQDFSRGLITQCDE